MAEQTLTGIDIGTSKVATLIARLNEGEIVPRIMGFASVASHGVKRGQIIDIGHITEAVEESIEKAERMAGQKIERAFAAVGGPHISSLNSHGVVAVQQPEVEITHEDVDRAIEAAKAISLSSTREVIEVIPCEYIVDGQEGIKNPIGMTGVRLEVNTHIITAGVTNLRNLERSLSDLGVEKTGMVFSGLASSLATVSDTEKELGVALVDIGGGKTDICLYVEGALTYSSSLAIGARHITNDIAVGLRVSLDSAEKIKLFLMEKGAKKHDLSTRRDELDVKHLRLAEGISSISYKSVVEGIIRPRLEEIFEKIYEEIEKSGFLTAVPAGLVLSGGGAQTIGAVAIAKRTIGLSARVGVPGEVTGLIDELLFPQFAAVTGLILYGRDRRAAHANTNLKNFTHIFRRFSFKGSFSKVIDMVKSFMP